MILISPFSRKLRNGNRNPKDYPYWLELVQLLKKDDVVIQIGRSGEQALGCDEFYQDYSLKDLMTLANECDTWVSVDNFFPHLASHTSKNGVVLFGKSDPLIFGYPNNVNVIKSREFLREKPFDIWESEAYNPDVFLTAKEIYDIILQKMSKNEDSPKI